MRTSSLPLIIAATLLASAAQAQTHDHASHGTDRQADVAARGAMVMPFDLDRSLHRFTPTESGGVQQVTSTDGDARQIALIRAHVRDEAGRFARGDFTSPEAIHGADMPGLATLASAGQRLRVLYAETPAGAELSFTASDPAIKDALHRWFAAQTRDHGRHAAGGKTGH